jgi:hypothetical protein
MMVPHPALHTGLDTSRQCGQPAVCELPSILMISLPLYRYVISRGMLPHCYAVFIRQS